MFEWKDGNSHYTHASLPVIIQISCQRTMRYICWMLQFMTTVWFSLEVTDDRDITRAHQACTFCALVWMDHYEQCQQCWKRSYKHWRAEGSHTASAVTQSLRKEVGRERPNVLLMNKIGRRKKRWAKRNSRGMFWRGHEKPYGNVLLMKVCLNAVWTFQLLVCFVVPVYITTCPSEHARCHAISSSSLNRLTKTTQMLKILQTLTT